MLDHVAEFLDVLEAHHAPAAAVVTVTIADDSLQLADSAWSAQDQPPPT